MVDFGQNTITNRQAVLDAIDTALLSSSSKHFIFAATHDDNYLNTFTISSGDLVPFQIIQSNGITYEERFVVDSPSGYDIVINKTASYKITIFTHEQVAAGPFVLAKDYTLIPFINMISDFVNTTSIGGIQRTEYITNFNNGDKLSMLYFGNIDPLELAVSETPETPNISPGYTIYSRRASLSIIIEEI